MNPLRSVVVRLALGLFLAVAGALALVYLILVPSLDRRLTNSKLSRLEKIAAILDVPHEEQSWPIFAADTAQAADARIVLFRVDRTGARPQVFIQGDSQTTVSTDVEDDPVAVEAATTLKEARGTVERNGTRYAEVAVPVRYQGVLLLSQSLRDSLGTIALVRRLLLIAGVIALLASLAVGYAAASVFSRRIKRLERAADRIAGGQFDEPVQDAGADELGQLASAFERMRLRLGELDNARREFIANASHELRTPIFSLSGFLELLSEEDLDDETRREFLGTMREQVDRLTRLATDLLDLSRLDAGRLHIERERIDLAGVADELAAEFGAVARAGGRELETETETETGTDATVPALADEGRVLQIGRVLVRNALVHAPPGSRVRIGATMRDGRAVLFVEDDGPGIAPDKTAHVFERFYRADGGVASGSGLGLAIAHDLAELMGGAIALESRPGRTVFRLVLPPAPEVVDREPVSTGKRLP